MSVMCPLIYESPFFGSNKPSRISDIGLRTARREGPGDLTRIRREGLWRGLKRPDFLAAFNAYKGVFYPSFFRLRSAEKSVRDRKICLIPVAKIILSTMGFFESSPLGPFRKAGMSKISKPDRTLYGISPIIVDTAARNKKIAALYKRGTSIAAIANRFNLSINHIYLIYRNAWLETNAIHSDSTRARKPPCKENL